MWQIEWEDFRMYSGDLLVSDPRCRKEYEDGFKVVVTSKDSEILRWPEVASILTDIACGNIPFYMAYSLRCGVLQSIFNCLVSMVITVLTFRIYISSWIYGTDNSYRAMANTMLTTAVGNFFEVVVVLTYLGVATNQCNEMVSGLDIILTAFSGTPSILENKWVYIFLFSFVVLVPPLLLPSFGRTLPISIASNVAIVVAIVCLAAILIQNVSKDGFDPNKRMILWGTDFGDTVYSFAIFNTSFFIQPLIPRVAYEMKDPTKKRVVKTFGTTLIAIAVLILSSGIIGYFIFFDAIPSGNFLNYFTSNSALVIIVKCCNVVVSYGITASFIYLISIEICDLFQPGSEKNLLCRLFSGLVVYLLVVFLVMSGSTAVTILNLISVLGFFLLGYIIPACIYLKMHAFRSVGLGVAAIIILVFIACLCGLFILQQVGML